MSSLEFLLLLLLHIFVPLYGSDRPASWLVDFRPHGNPVRAVRELATKYDLTYQGRIGGLHGMYLLETRGDHDFRTRRRRWVGYEHVPYHSRHEMIEDITNSLYHEHGVQLVEYQKSLKRTKRGYLPNIVPPFDPSSCCETFDDPEYANQWVYQNPLRLDMNIRGAWQLNITGKGVVVTILDDGVEHRHDDLRDNWDVEASYDFNDKDHDPTPRMTDNSENMHGTRCAGQVAASANNSKCGVGAAFEASIGGIRMLDGRITDKIECLSISYKRNHIDIYSMSWGPDDDGKTVDGPGACTKRALREGVRKGRNGKGSIFVWASGNGGPKNDDCNLDGYVSSIYTIAISAISSSGLSPWYSESCACTLASAYSSGFKDEDKIWTTDVENTCTNEHTGTSAAAPLAVGVLALVLQANPELTWRDMQHLIVRTANPVSNDSDDKWATNGAGHKYHPKLGFGVLDATGMVVMAKNWTTVQPQRRCTPVAVSHSRIVPPQKILNMMITVRPEECGDEKTGRRGMQYIHRLEHVQLVLSMKTAVRGDIVLKLTSPSGTTSKLLSMRPEDMETREKSAFKNWQFMSVHFWDEMPYGRWQFQIINGNQKISHMLQQTKMRKFKIVFWGTGQQYDEYEGELEENEEGGPNDSNGDPAAEEDPADMSTPGGFHDGYFTPSGP